MVFVQNECFCILTERYFMQKFLLLYVVIVSLFVSCKQRNHIHDLPLVNIGSLKPVSKNVLDIDMAVYRKEVNDFLSQRFSSQSELAYIPEDNVYAFTDKDIKTVSAKTAHPHRSRLKSAGTYRAAHFFSIKKSLYFLDKCLILYLCTPVEKTESIAQLVRASDCGSEGRGFETPCSPAKKLRL